MEVDNACTKLGNLVKFLPTGTVFVYHFLSPVLTDNGNCSNTLDKYSTGTLIALCGFFCCFSCFTDSYTGSDGATHYGVATVNGIWPSRSAESLDLSTYKLRFGDFVHAFFALIVFGVLVLLEPNAVQCFYPSFATNAKTFLLLVVLPPLTLLLSLVFMFFPNNRHGIGYPLTQLVSNKIDPLLPQTNK